MAIRYFRNGPATTLVASISGSDTLITVADASSFPTLYPYTLILDHGEGTEEVVDVTAAAGNQLTVTRGVDATTAFPHAGGALVVHGVSARDAREANAHVNATSAVHGVTGALLGSTDTQAMSNKTITSSTLSGGTISGSAITGGTATGLVLKETSAFQPSTAGGKVSVKTSGGTEVGFIDGNGHAQLPRLEVLSTTIGQPTLKVKGVAAQTENLLTIQDSGALSALNVGPDRRVGINSAPGSATTLLVRATTATDVGLLVAGAASQSTHLIRATDSALSTKFYVDQSGNVFANGNIDSADFTDWASYTPLWANAGSATFATRTGRWRRIGKKTVAFYIFVEIDNAGSGGTNVTTTLPTVPNRTIRQTFGGHAEGISASINAVCAVGGSTNVVDAMLLNSSSGTGNITGVACTAGRKFTIEGIYEEA